MTKIEMIKEVAKGVPGGFWEGDAGVIVSEVHKKYPATQLTKQSVFTARSDQRKRDKREGKPVVPVPDKFVTSNTKYTRIQAAVAESTSKPKPRPSVLVADLREMVRVWGWDEVRDVLDALKG